MLRENFSSPFSHCKLIIPLVSRKAEFPQLGRFSRSSLSINNLLSKGVEYHFDRFTQRLCFINIAAIILI